MAQYEVSVVTGKALGAGTDSLVYVTLEGTAGVTEELHLADSGTNKDPFERGQTDVFLLQVR